MVAFVLKHLFYDIQAPSAASERSTSDAKLRPMIAAIFAEKHETYGSPRVHVELVGRGFEIGRQRDAQLMREMGLQAVPEKRHRRATDSKHSLGFAPDLVDKDFEPEEPNRLWASDITYIWTDDGWGYLAIVLDLFSRKVVSWAVADHMRGELVLDALDRALTTREVDGDLVHHSDRGSQYSRHAFRERCVSRK